MTEKNEDRIKTWSERIKNWLKQGVALLFIVLLFIFLIRLFNLFFSEIPKIFSSLKYFYVDNIPTLIFATELIILLVVLIILLFKLITKLLSDEE